MTGLGASRVVEATGMSVTVIVPLQVRRRSGRPRIIVPDEQDAQEDGASAAVLRAIARAWSWRRRLEAGGVATLQDLADAEKVTLPFVSRVIRLAYLSPAVLERIVCGRAAVAVSLDQLAATATVPWADQARTVFDGVDQVRDDVR